jgi:hypothetical protein
MKEHAFQNQVRLELSKIGYITFRTNVGKVKLHDGRWFETGLPVGFSDIIALKNGKTYFIELKQGKRMATKEQLNFIEQMKRNGFSAGIAYNMDDVLKIINN